MEKIYIFCRLSRTSAVDYGSNSRPYESIRQPFCWAVSPPIHELPSRITEFSWSLYQPVQGFPFDSVPTGLKKKKKFKIQIFLIILLFLLPHKAVIQNHAQVSPLEHGILAISCSSYQGEYNDFIKQYSSLR